MKKMYVCIAAFFLSTGTQAQVVVDFENFLTAPSSFENNAGSSNAFHFAGLDFTNYYDSTWGSWSGFAISNMEDSTTPGWGNQYSAITGSGVNLSSTYAIAYPSATISCTGNAHEIQSFYVTNTTYAALSMRDGDAFGKQFGSPNGANGQPDGTNGADYFKLWIICEDAFSNAKDSIEFYLADYQFANDSLDYILDDWSFVSLDTIPFPVKSVRFRLESSDNGGGYMNTPGYFAIDNVAFSGYLDLPEAELVAWESFPNPFSEQLTIRGSYGELSVRDAQGRLVHVQNHEGTSILATGMWPSGVYYLTLVNETGTDVKKLIK